MDPFMALKQANTCVRLAEDAADGPDREGYLKSARLWLERIDFDGWFQRKQSPAVIIASEEK